MRTRRMQGAQRVSGGYYYYYYDYYYYDYDYDYEY